MISNRQIIPFQEVHARPLHAGDLDTKALDKLVNDQFDNTLHYQHYFYYEKGWISDKCPKLIRSELPYLMAAKGKILFIEMCLALYPQLIYQGWSGYEGDHDNNFLIDSSDKSWSEYLCANVVTIGALPTLFYALANPLFGAALVTSIVLLDKTGKKQRDQLIGMTLLDFAAFEGKTEMAAYLLRRMQDDKINDRFLEIAAKQGHHDFVVTLRDLITDLKASLLNKNKVIELTIDLNKINHDLNKAKKLYDDVNNILGSNKIVALDACAKLADINQKNQLLLDQGKIHEQKFNELQVYCLEQLKAALARSNNRVNAEVLHWEGMLNGLTTIRKEIYSKSAEMTQKNGYRMDHAKRWDNAISQINEIRLNPHVSELVKQNCQEVIKKYEDELASFLKDNDFAYSIEDVSKCVKALITRHLGGYKVNHKYLLEKKFNEVDMNCHVAALYDIKVYEGNTDTYIGIPIAFALDIDEQVVPEQVDNRYDLFMDIREIITSAEDQNIKILAPCISADFHWVTLEIMIVKSANNYTVSMMLHDPYGGGMLAEPDFEKIRSVIIKKITQLNAQAVVDTMGQSASPYPRRLQHIDTASSGIVVVRDIEERIQGKGIGGQDCYPLGSLLRRELQWMDVQDAQMANELNTNPQLQAASSRAGFFSRNPVHALRMHAADYGYRCSDVPRNGNCLFYAVIDQLQAHASVFFREYLQVMAPDICRELQIPCPDTFEGIQTRVNNPLLTQINLILRTMVAKEVENNLEFYRGFLLEPAKFIREIKIDKLWNSDDHEVAPQILARIFKMDIIFIRNNGEVGYIQINELEKQKVTICLGNEKNEHYQSLHVNCEIIHPLKDINTAITAAARNEAHIPITLQEAGSGIPSCFKF